MKILIVGAGPTGLTAAIELYRRGFTPRLVDRKEAPSPLSRAVGINAHSLDLLEASGATQALLERGHKIRQVRIHEGGNVIGTIRLDILPHRFNFLLALPQNETESVMNDVLAGYGGAVEYGHKLTAATFENGRVQARINDGAPEEYNLIIAADGVHSHLRETAGIAFEGYDYPTRWSIADFESHDWQSKNKLGDAEAFILPDGHVRFVVRIGPHRYRAVADQPEALPGIPVDFTLDELHRKDDFVISIRQAATYQKPPLYLAGDAAHAHSPAGARGMNMGIADACDLARRIAENDLAGYTAARRPAGTAWIKTSERLIRAMTTRNRAAKKLRRAVLWILSTFPVLQKPQLKTITGIGRKD